MQKRLELHLWYAIRFKVFERDGFTCQYCGQAAPNVRLEVDHRLSLVEGGTNGLDNLVTACWSCNRGKEWARLSPLFVKHPDEPVGRNARQREVVALIETKPGITPREIQDRLGVTTGNLYVVLSRLRRAGLVAQRRVGRATEYSLPA